MMKAVGKWDIFVIFLKKNPCMFDPKKKLEYHGIEIRRLRNPSMIRKYRVNPTDNISQCAKKMLLLYCFDPFLCVCRVQWTLCLVIDLSLGAPPTILYHWYNIKSRSFGCYSRWESGIPYVFQTWFFFPGFCLLLLFPISLAVRWKLSTKVPVRAFHARFAE